MGRRTRRKKSRQSPARQRRNAVAPFQKAAFSAATQRRRWAHIAAGIHIRVLSAQGREENEVHRRYCFRHNRHAHSRRDESCATYSSDPPKLITGCCLDVTKEWPITKETQGGIDESSR